MENQTKIRRQVIEEDDDEEGRERGGRRQIFITGDDLISILDHVCKSLHERGDYKTINKVIKIQKGGIRG